MLTNMSIKEGLSSKAILTIHPRVAQQLEIENWFIGYVRFGLESKEVKVYQSESVSEKEIELSKGLIEDLMLPTFCVYDLIAEGNEIKIGPFIGILGKGNTKTLTKYVKDYPKIRGAIMSFSLTGIDEDALLIDGSIYNPTLNSWERGKYGYPGVIFKKVGISKFWREHFHSLLNNRVFNTYKFNKWEMYNWLKNIHELKEHLPYTAKLAHPEEIFNKTRKFRSVYIKPVIGSLGSGIKKVHQEGGKFILSYRKNNKNINVVFNNKEDALKHFGEIFREKTYIIQEGLELQTTDKRMIDFRAIVLKNEEGKWEALGLLCKCGTVGSVISNRAAGGSLDFGIHALQEVYGLSKVEALIKHDEILQVALEAAKGIDMQGLQYGNLGIDMALDKHGHIWLIEINNRDPHHSLILSAGDEELFQKVNTKNMLYARFLAGF
ncbi:YheC/YheD family protein [Bacillus timonensis]|nr:YheC/YheD family protein [Bacillus timonensis]